ncbi:hypothetical protein KR018_002481, partial [Drosophila ironensis]
PNRSSTSVQLLLARRQCQALVTPEQRLRLDKNQFQDVPSVHRYLHCFWSRMHLWQDATGFQAMAIVQRFGGIEIVNVEQALPSINGCNQKTKWSQRRHGPIGWCYLAFTCVLRTPVGDWYRRHMSDVINGNA